MRNGCRKNKCVNHGLLQNVRPLQNWKNGRKTPARFLLGELKMSTKKQRSKIFKNIDKN